jgi:hypothetical protein
MKVSVMPSIGSMGFLIRYIQVCIPHNYFVISKGILTTKSIKIMQFMLINCMNKFAV